MTLIIVFTDIIVIEKKFNNLSFKSIHSSHFDNLDKLDNLNPQKESTEKRKIKVYDTASELYNDFLGIYYHKYYELSGDKSKKKVCFVMDMIIVCGQKLKKN